MAQIRFMTAPSGLDVWPAGGASQIADAPLSCQRVHKFVFSYFQFLWKMTNGFSIDEILRKPAKLQRPAERPPKAPRKRCSFNSEQISRLESEFKKHRYLTAAERAELAFDLRLTQQQVKIWFQNRRYKSKKTICCWPAPAAAAAKVRPSQPSKQLFSAAVQHQLQSWRRGLVLRNAAIAAIVVHRGAAPVCGTR